MNKKIEEFLKTAKDVTSKNSPTILTGLAVVGLITTAVLAYKASPKMEKIVSKAKQDLSDTDPDDKETKRVVIKETVKAATPVMAPVAVMGIATTACIIGSNRISNKRVATLSAAYALAERSVKDLNDKMTEVLGEKKTRSIKDAISKDKLAAMTPVTDDEYITTGADGSTRCRDGFTGRPFWSNAQRIERAINKLSNDIRSEMFISLNQFYEEIGLDTIPNGDNIGWNIDDLRYGTIPVSFTALLDEHSNPVLYIDDTSCITIEHVNGYL